MMQKKYLRIFSISKNALFLIIIGSLTWSVTMVKSGLSYSYGLGFWGANGHDGVWHIALAKSLARGSWEMPVFAGEPIKNYHIGFDLLLAIVHKITFIPVETLYFQVLPPIFAFLLGYLVYMFALSWTKSSSRAFWATFFIYFAGGWSWIISLLKNGRIDGESMLWSQQAVSTLINPPYSLSLIILMAGLIFLIKGIRSKPTQSAGYYLLSTFLFGLLVQIKVYAGILALGGLLVIGLIQLFRKREISLIKVFTGALVISIIIFAPLDSNGSSSLIFRPFWFLETMMSDIDRLYWPRMASAMLNYKLGGIWIKAFFVYLAVFFIFLLGNLGTRLINGYYIFNRLKKWKKIGYLDAFILSVIVAGVIIPMFFIQKGTSWNTIQFFYYPLFFSGILAGIALADFLEKIKNPILYSTVTAGVILLTIPVAIGTLWNHYLPVRPPAMISKDELEALKFLEKQPEGIVLTLPFDREMAKQAESNPPRPLYVYESTAYVSAFSNKPVYLEDEVNLEITGYNWKQRRSEVENYLSRRGWIGLPGDSISYLYFVRPLNHYFRISGSLENIFSNNEVDIYRVRRISN